MSSYWNVFERFLYDSYWWISRQKFRPFSKSPNRSPGVTSGITFEVSPKIRLVILQEHLQKVLLGFLQDVLPSCTPSGRPPRIYVYMKCSKDFFSSSFKNFQWFFQQSLQGLRQKYLKKKKNKSFENLYGVLQEFVHEFITGFISDFFQRFIQFFFFQKTPPMLPSGQILRSIQIS